VGHRVGIVAAVRNVGINLRCHDKGADDSVRIEFVDKHVRPVSIGPFHGIDDHRNRRDAAGRRQQIVELGARAGENQHLTEGRIVVRSVRGGARLPGGRLRLTHAGRIAEADVIPRIDQQLADGDRASVRAKNRNLHLGVVPTLATILALP
jgi:hypothetical protein